MMGTVYKRSISDLAILRISPDKVARWYYILMTIGIVLCGYLCYRSVQSFAEVGMAEDKVHFFEDNRSMLVYFLNVGFIILIVISNLHSLTSKRISWLYYILTFSVYAVYAVIDSFFLQDTYFHFKQINQLWHGGFKLEYYWGYLSLFFCAALTAFNAYMTSWGLKK
jgi:hypothetical protein